MKFYVLTVIDTETVNMYLVLDTDKIYDSKDTIFL